MDKVLVVGLLIVASVITASILFVVFRTSIEESEPISEGLQKQAGEQAQTSLTIVEVIPGIDASKVDLWVKNIGGIDVGLESSLELFLIDTNSERGGYLRYSDTGPAFQEDTWSVVGGVGGQFRPGETIQLHADLFRTPLTAGDYIFTVSSLNAVSSSIIFSADPNAPLPPQPPPPPPPPQQFTLGTNALPANAGRVTGAGVYLDGTSAPVTAIVNAGFAFDNWSGDCSGTTPNCTVVMNSDKSVTGNFSRAEFALTGTAAPLIGGDVTGSGTYPINTTVTVTQTNRGGFTFDNWSGDCSGTTPTCTVVMDSDKTVIANYSPDPPNPPPAGCTPTPPAGAPVLNSIDMNSGYPRQMLSVQGDTANASVIWGAGSGTETTITTGVNDTRYFQVPDNAAPGSYPVAIEVGAARSNIVCVTVLAASGVFPGPRIDYIGLNGRTGSDIALTVSAANMDQDATLTVNGVTISNSDLWGVIPVPYLLSHVPSTYGYPIYHYSQLKGIVSNATPGSVLTVTVTNTDGQASTKSYALPATWADLDSDGDGLLDSWEDGVYIGVGGGPVNLAAMGVSKYRKDLLVEADWMPSSVPTEGVFTKSIEIFKNAPVLNPDGTSGIDMRIDRGQGGEFTEGGDILSAGTTIEMGHNPMVRFADLNLHTEKQANFNLDRLGIFKYAVFGQRRVRGSSGQAEFPQGFSTPNVMSASSAQSGDDVLVTCYWCNENGHVGTFIHELGHALSLTHGGILSRPEPSSWEHNQYKPTTPSVMSYRYQIPGTNASCTLTPEGLYTYSQGQMRTIDETGTDENIGVCDNRAIDLTLPNPDGRITVGVINSDSPRPGPWSSADDIHMDADQWGNIVLDFRIR